VSVGNAALDADPDQIGLHTAIIHRAGAHACGRLRAGRETAARCRAGRPFLQIGALMPALRRGYEAGRAEYAPASMSAMRVGPVGAQPRSSCVTVLVAARSMPKKVPIHPK
jgi:hypothetical protein